MRHDYRLIQNMLIAGKIDTNEFKERIDAIKTDTYMGTGREVYERRNKRRRVRGAVQ